MVQFSTKTLRHPPLTSLPMTTPPCPSSMEQRRTMMFWLGRFQRRPSALRPLLMAIQSSPVWKRQSSINTPSHDSGSQPSPLGPSFQKVTPRTTTFLLRRGCSTQKGERSKVTPSTNTPSQSTKLTSWGRKVCPCPKILSSTGTLFSAIFMRFSRSPSFCAGMPSFQPKRAEPHIGHQLSIPAPPSMVPSPVMATSLASRA